MRPTRPALLIAGFASGLMGTLTSVGGPPIALVYQNATGPEMRSTLNAYFALGGLLSMAVLGYAGRFGQRELAWGVALLPAVAVGFWLSGALRARLDRGRTRGAVLVLAGACSAGRDAQGAAAAVRGPGQGEKMGERGPHGQLCWAAVSSPFPVSEPTGDEPSAPDMDAPVSPEDAQRLTERTRDAIALLQAIQERRGLLAHIDLELRTELMRVAGQVARPSPYEKRELSRAVRRKRREDLRNADEAALARTGIRKKRAEQVFVTPPARHSIPVIAGGDIDACSRTEPSRPRPNSRRARARGPRPSARSRSGAPATSAKPSSTSFTSSTTRCAAAAPISTTEARADRGPVRARRAGHRCAREDRLSGRDHAAARRALG